MAVNGVFTIEDLYGGRSLNYYHHHNQLLPSALKTSFLSVNNELTTIAIEFKKIEKSNKLGDVIPFTYFYWVLLVLAIILSFILIIFFIYYCHTFVKNYRTRRNSSSSHYRYRSVHRHLYANKPSSILATSTPARPILKTGTFPLEPVRILPKPVCPSISLKFTDEQLYRQDSEDTSSLPSVRHDVFLKEPLSTFMSSSSNLSSGLQHSQLSSRLSEPPLKLGQSFYESQQASINMNLDEHANDSLIINVD